MWPRLIYDGGQLVGVIMAAFAPEHKNPLFPSYLWRLNIDAGHATSPQVRVISRM